MNGTARVAFREVKGTNKTKSGEQTAMKYRPHLGSANRYSLWFTAIFTSGFVQGALFVTGDGCHHEPAPAQCHKGGALVALGNVSSAFWCTSVTSLLVYLLFWLFNRPFSYGPVTDSEQQKFLEQWSRKQFWGSIILVTFNLLFSAFILRLFQYYPWALLEKWMAGLSLSSISGMGGSVMFRALSFVRAVLVQMAQRGGRTWRNAGTNQHGL